MKILFCRGKDKKGKLKWVDISPIPSATGANAYKVLKELVERAEREDWDFGGLTSENYKDYLYGGS